MFPKYNKFQTSAPNQPILHAAAVCIPLHMPRQGFCTALDSLCSGADNAKVVIRVSTAPRLRFGNGDLLLAAEAGNPDSVAATVNQHDPISLYARLNP
jgi:hypothetical protein